MAGLRLLVDKTIILIKAKIFTMKQKAFYSITVHPDIKGEWERKEYGSWEDHGSPSTGHVVSLMKNSPKTRIVCQTKEDAQILVKSASYQTSWEGNYPIEIRLMRFAARVCKELDAKLNPVIDLRTRGAIKWKL